MYVHTYKTRQAVEPMALEADEEDAGGLRSRQQQRIRRIETRRELGSRRAKLAGGSLDADARCKAEQRCSERTQARESRTELREK
jgi:hypothetical protein